MVVLVVMIYFFVQRQSDQWGSTLILFSVLDKGDSHGSNWKSYVKSQQR
jgi:hypothetical protein